MISRIWAALLLELTKALRSRGAYVGPLLLTVATAVTVIFRPLSRDSVSDYGFVCFATVTILHGPGLLLTLVYCSGLVAGESGGTLRSVLVRPILRHEFLTAKLLYGMTYTTVLTALTASVAWSLAWFLGDLQDISSGGQQVFSANEMREAFLLGALFSLPAQWAAVAFALLGSVCLRNAVSAAIVTVGAWLLLDICKYPLHLDAYLFSTYLERSWDVFQARCDGLEASWAPLLRQGLPAALAGLFVCFGGAVFAFRRRDLV